MSAIKVCDVTSFQQAEVTQRGAHGQTDARLMHLDYLHCLSALNSQKTDNHEVQGCFDRQYSF